MKKAFITLVVLATQLSLVSCGNKGNTPSASSPVVEQRQDQYINMNGLSAQSGIGFASDNFNQKALTITNINVYKRFLKEAMAICDRNSYNSGLSSCQAYINGYLKITLQAIDTQTKTASIIVEAGPTYNYGGGWYNVALPSAKQAASCGLTWMLTGRCAYAPSVGEYSIARNPLKLDLTVSVINNYQGFEGRGYGAYWTPSQIHLVQLQVLNGKLEDGSFQYQLAYDGMAGGVFAKGTMTRCQDSLCRLNQY